MFESHNNIAAPASDYLTKNASMDTGCLIFSIKAAVDIDTPSVRQVFGGFVDDFGPRGLIMWIKQTFKPDTLDAA